MYIKKKVITLKTVYDTGPRTGKINLFTVLHPPQLVLVLTELYTTCAYGSRDGDDYLKYNHYKVINLY